MKQYHIITVLIVLLAVAGCATRKSQRWSLTPPAGRNSPWARVLPSLTFSNATLPEVCVELERLANLAAQPAIKISVTGRDHGPDSPVITFRAKQIELIESLRIVGEVTGYRPVYGLYEVVLAPQGHADGQSPVVLHGRCFSNSTGRPISQFSLVCTRIAMMFDDEPTTTVYEVETTPDGSYSISVPVSAYSDVVSIDRDHHVSDNHPTPQTMTLMAISDSHLPSRLKVALVKTNLRYTVDIGMEQ